MKRLVVVLLSLAACPLALVPAGAQKRSPQNPCEKFATQAEAGECAYKDYKAADAELNKAYNQLAAKLDAGERSRLKDAELAWINYRDKDCEYESSFYLGGTMRPMIESLCLARVTRARAAELREQLKFRQEQ